MNPRLRAQRINANVNRILNPVGASVSAEEELERIFEGDDEE